MCISRLSKRGIAEKDPLRSDQAYTKVCPIKKGAGRQLAPHNLPFAWLLHHAQHISSGGQNLAALCTATSQNLTAVSSSHSLAEAMNLGTVALGGLVGTLHSVHLLSL